jgi:FMN phosphatase YigB (HAD superfamily)
MYEEVLKTLKVKKSEAIMVGDSMETDIKGGESAGVKAVLIDRRGRREYKNKVSNLTEIEQFLKL